MGLFGRKKDSVPASSGSGDPRLERVRSMALANDDEGVERLLKQMDAEGVPNLAQDALDLGISLWATDDQALAAMFVLSVVPILDSVDVHTDVFIQSNYYCGLAMLELDMDEMANSYLKTAADLGMANAQYMYSLSLEGAEMLKYLEMAAAQGLEDAQRFMRENPQIIADARAEAGQGGLGGGGFGGGMNKPGGAGLGGGGLGGGGLGGGGLGSAPAPAPEAAPAAGAKAFCTSCGSQLAAGARFCAGCGTAV